MSAVNAEISGAIVQTKSILELVAGNLHTSSELAADEISTLYVAVRVAPRSALPGP